MMIPMNAQLKGKSSRQRRRQSLGSSERDILEAMTLGDLLYSFLLSARSTKRFYKLARERAAHRHRRKKTIERLIELDFIRAHGEKLSITAAGKSALGHVVSDTFNLLQTQSWDHKWRIVIFDIPEKYAALRNKIRDILKRAGFIKLQQSAWVFPHDCEDLVQLLKQESQLSQYVLYGVLEKIEDEARLKKLFNLKK